MHSLRKSKVVIASTLKPVDDTRLYEKIGLTLAESRQFEVHIIGTPGQATPDVDAHPHSKINRISWNRFKLPFIILKKILKLEPDILIFATHELLFAAACYKLIRRKRIIYDVQENYFLNIIYTDAFPFLLRWPIAAWVRLKEIVLGPVVDRFLLAENGFVEELTFARHNATVIENKAVVGPGFNRNPPSDRTQLLFTGTIDHSTGIFEAIALAISLHSDDEGVFLHIIGYCPRRSVFEAVRKAISGHPFITFTGGENLLPHHLIIGAIREAHFGLICYRPSPHVNNRMPTKLYEYMAHRLPILIRHNLWWRDVVEKANAGIAIDFANPVLPASGVDVSQFYPGGKRNLSYEFDKAGLLAAVEQ